MSSSDATRAKVAGAILVLGLLLPSCLKKEEFPPEPAITFKSFERFANADPDLADSASLVVSFTDGDGDVGLDASDNQPPFDAGGDHYYNFFVDMEEFTNGAWVPVEFQVPLHYRIPRITPTGQNKALEGEIAVAIKPWPLLPDPSIDTVRFNVHMMDRSLNASNTAVSNAIKVDH